MKVLIKTIVGSFLFASLFVGCSEDIMDDINKNRNDITEVTSKQILTDLVVSTSFSMVGQDLNTYSSIFVEHEGGVYDQMWSAQNRLGLTSASTFSNTWNNGMNNIKNAKDAIAKAEAERNYQTKGMAQVLLAINAAILTDFFGDIPFSQAGELTPEKTPKYLQPDVDSQQNVYEQIFSLLQEAIVNLSKTNQDAQTSRNDYLYGADAEKWTKFAYGLLAKYKLQLLYRSSNKNQDLQEVLQYANQSFTSVAEQADFNVYSSTNLNPTFDYQYSREGLGASKSLADKLIERKDPRFARLFFDVHGLRVETSTSANYLPVPNDQDPSDIKQTQKTYNRSVFGSAQTASTLLLSYHQLMFIKAEAYARLGDKTNAQEALKKAFLAGVDNMEASVKTALESSLQQNPALQEKTSVITKQNAEQYFNNTVVGLFNANPLKEVMIQKYFACFGASGESFVAYNDIRRLQALGENFIELKNPLNTNKFPQRGVYGTSDNQSNIKVRKLVGDGSYIFTEKVWWAGGTR